MGWDRCGGWVCGGRMGLGWDGFGMGVWGVSVGWGGCVGWDGVDAGR